MSRPLQHCVTWHRPERGLQEAQIPGAFLTRSPGFGRVNLTTAHAYLGEHHFLKRFQPWPLNLSIGAGFCRRVFPHVVGFECFWRRGASWLPYATCLKSR
ncbi:hypothetical protein D9M69_655420 [compost metagenome]